MGAARSDGSIILSTLIDQSGINKGMATMKNGIKSLSGSIAKLGAAVGVAFGISEMVRFGKEAVNLASDLQEVQNVVDTAFDSMSYKIEKFTQTSIEKFGLSKLAAKQTGSSYMAMAKGMQFADDIASDMALTLTGLSADMASFYNISQEEARTALSAVYTGETETLKRYGILITEVNLQEFARQKGITKSINAMTQREKVMLRYQYVLKSTELAQGDFAKTSDSWVNQTKTLSERWKEMQAVWGQAFMTLGTLVLPTINNIIAGLTRVGQAAQEAAQWIYKAFTGKDLEVKAANAQADAIGGAVENQESLTDAVKETEKAQKKALASFDELNQLTDNTAENSGSAIDIGSSVNTGTGNESSGSIEEKGEGFDLSKYDELLERLKAIAVVVSAIGAGLLAWQISQIITQDLLKFLVNLLKISGILMIIAGSLLLVKGYSDAWVNGVNWNNLTTMIVGLGIAIAAIALSSAPLFTAIALITAGVTLLVVGIRDFIKNGYSMQNVIMITTGVITTLIGVVLLLNKSLLANPMTWVVVGVIALASAFTILWNECEGFRNFFIEMGNSIKEAWENVWSMLSGIFDKIKEAIKSVKEIFSGFGSGSTNYSVEVSETAAIQSLDFSSYSIPKLAQGAVIPPNREFLAVLGDQTSGTNIEAPLDTIKQAVSEVIGSSGLIGGQQSVTLELDGYKLARTSVPYWNNENRRLRTRLTRR